LSIRYNDNLYAIEVKSFTNPKVLKEAITQAAEYGKQLGLSKIVLAQFVENIPADFRQKHEVIETNEKTGVTVEVIFVDVIQPR
ncbi:MAG: hypothetical protein B6242_06980, partial [Anaerolineaceae bacterium 4572_78]